MRRRLAPLVTATASLVAFLVPLARTVSGATQEDKTPPSPRRPHTVRGVGIKLVEPGR